MAQFLRASEALSSGWQYSAHRKRAVRWLRGTLYENEAVHFRTGALIYSPHFLPGPLASRIANGLPAKSLVSVGIQAISGTTQAHRIHSWRLTVHTHSISLSEILRPSSQRTVVQGTVRSQGLCLELHTVSSILSLCRPLWRCGLYCSLLVECRACYKGRNKGMPAVPALR